VDTNNVKLLGVLGMQTAKIAGKTYEYMEYPQSNSKGGKI
jgi:hypothetical protein